MYLQFLFSLNMYIFEEMAFGLYSLLESTILFVNALAVLNRDRFLRKIGLVPESKSGNDKLLGLANFIHSIQTYRRYDSQNL
ncbi:Immediate early response 3-interacting protein 1 [Trichinella sp. T8]|uniref:Immediate early response 3-interacting protein 1 n=1 Tax=Trichinella murrelli TaxID=144512 RepID=A0A0V0TPJ9_9BILA|nr:Immediate early response 3-interacting protein 1 [Trichinella murrelli]KRZ95782.1 Immediate early response 3-interacting protein 1 [Trichinella sp. T8]